MDTSKLILLGSSKVDRTNWILRLEKPYVTYSGYRYYGSCNQPAVDQAGNIYLVGMRYNDGVYTRGHYVKVDPEGNLLFSHSWDDNNQLVNDIGAFGLPSIPPDSSSWVYVPVDRVGDSASHCSFYKLATDGSSIQPVIKAWLENTAEDQTDGAGDIIARSAGSFWLNLPAKYSSTPTTKVFRAARFSSAPTQQDALVLSNGNWHYLYSRFYFDPVVTDRIYTIISAGSYSEIHQDLRVINTSGNTDQTFQNTRNTDTLSPTMNDLAVVDTGNDTRLVVLAGAFESASWNKNSFFLRAYNHNGAVLGSIFRGVSSGTSLTSKSTKLVHVGGTSFVYMDKSLLGKATFNMGSSTWTIDWERRIYNSSHTQFQPRYLRFDATNSKVVITGDMDTNSVGNHYGTVYDFVMRFDPSKPPLGDVGGGFGFADDVDSYGYSSGMTPPTFAGANSIDTSFSHPTTVFNWDYITNTSDPKINPTVNTLRTKL